ncbi:hypothetical protein CRUP_018003 [Coryphaenoides rupestris]|nr:hypothetical protein CRUP_018003 [Coryphaenoides rupestris]
MAALPEVPQPEVPLSSSSSERHRCRQMEQPRGQGTVCVFRLMMVKNLNQSEDLYLDRHPVSTATPLHRQPEPQDCVCDGNVHLKIRTRSNPPHPPPPHPPAFKHNIVPRIQGVPSEFKAFPSVHQPANTFRRG